MLTRPVITVVDDEPQALAALLDALARRFGGDYRIVSHLSARRPRRSRTDPGRRRAGSAGYRGPVDARNERDRAPRPSA
jgi:hypothetical protein